MNKHLVCMGMAAIFSSIAAAGELQDILDSAAARADKTVNLESRTYFVTEPVKLDAKHSGISVRGCVGTVISGGTNVNGWIKDGDFWRAKIDRPEKALTSIFVNGARRAPAESGFIFISGKTPHDKTRAFFNRTHMKIAVSDAQWLLKLPQSEVENVQCVIFSAWRANRVMLKSVAADSDGKYATVVFKEPGYCCNVLRNDAAARCKFFNAKPLLGGKGKFYYDAASQTVWYYPFDGEDIARAEVFYPSTDTLVSASGTPERRLENFSIDGVEFAGASFKFNCGETWDVRSQAAADAPAAVSFSFAKNVRVENCVFRACEAYALEFGKAVWDSSAKNCVVRGVGAGGFKVGTLQTCRKLEIPAESDGLTSGRIEISDNIVCDYGRVWKSGVGVLVFDCVKISVIHNDIFDGYYTGVSLGWSWNLQNSKAGDNTIAFNRIHHLSYGELSDLGGIYTLGLQPRSQIVGNVVSDVSCRIYGGHGIYGDQGSGGFFVRKNFVRGVQSAGYFMNFGGVVRVENNLFADSDDWAVGLQNPKRSVEAEKSFYFERNIVLLKGSRFFGANVNAVFDNAVFDKNIYWSAMGKINFGKMSFEQWRAFGQDKNSFVIPVDVAAIINGAPVEQIGFEPLEISKAGVRGAMKDPLSKILETYKYPALDCSAKKHSDKDF